MNFDTHDVATRLAALTQALANLRAQGRTPPPAVVALFERYAQGELSWNEVQEAMRGCQQALLHYQDTLRRFREDVFSGHR